MNFRRCLWVILVFYLIILPVYASQLDNKIDDLSKQIISNMVKNKALINKDNKVTIAVIEFATIDNKNTLLGRSIAEQLTTKLFLTQKFDIIERGLLNKVLAELQLNTTSIIDSESAKKLGKVLGVSAIVTGTITELDKNIQLNARLIATETGLVFGVAAVEMKKDADVNKLLTVNVSERQIESINNTAPVSPLKTATKESVTNESASGSVLISGSNLVTVFKDDFNRDDSSIVGNGWTEEQTNDGKSDFKIFNHQLFAPMQKTHGIRLANRIGRIDNLIFRGKFKRDELKQESDSVFFINANSDKIGTGQAAWPMDGLYWGFIPMTIAGNNRERSGVIMGYGDYDGTEEELVEWIPKVNVWYEFEWRIGKFSSNMMELYIWEDGSEQPLKPMITFNKPLDYKGKDLIIWTSHDGHNAYWDDIEIYSGK